MKVLLVDDDQINSKMLCKRLEKRELNVVQVFNGTDCLKYIQTHDDVDIVLLDIMMPDMSGDQVLVELRKVKSAFQLPIIMVTAKTEDSDVVQSLKCGANDFIAKPVNIDVAIARIHAQASLKDMHERNLKNQKLQTLNSMIVTFNHEINNPLTIAIGMLNRLKKTGDMANIEKVQGALERIAEIVKKIDGLSSGDITETDYGGGEKMIKLK